MGKLFIFYCGTDHGNRLPVIMENTSNNAADTHTHTHQFNDPFSRTTQVSQYQKGKSNLDFTEARGSGISWAICKSATRSRQTTTPAPPTVSFLQAGCPSYHPTNGVKAFSAYAANRLLIIYYIQFILHQVQPCHYILTLLYNSMSVHLKK